MRASAVSFADAYSKLTARSMLGPGHFDETCLQCGLELDLFCQRTPGLGTISIGANLMHSPKESVSHSLVAKTWPIIQI